MRAPKAIETYDWGAMTWLARGVDVGASLAEMSLSGRMTSPAHRHDTCSEILHVRRGTVYQRIGNNWIELNDGDTIVVPVGAVHQSKNLSNEEASLIICYSVGDRDYIEVDS